MPKIQSPIYDTDQTVARPAALDVVQQVKRFTDLPEEVPVLYTGPDGQTYQPGSSMEGPQITNQVRGSMYNQLSLEVEEEFQHDAFLTTPVEHPEHLFIFRDDYLDTYVKPGYSAMDVTINIKFRAQDRNTADRWRNQMRMKISRGHLVNLHTITYSYFIPPAQLEILKEIHRLRENVAPYGQDWDTYFKQTVTEKATIVTDQGARNQAWAIAESQMRIQGYWDFDGAPEKGSREAGGETWTITVGYKFSYMKPVITWMKYPLMVHNQLLDQKWRPEEGPYEVEKQERAYQWSIGAFSTFEKTYNMVKLEKREGYELPAFDEWLPDAVQPFTQRLASIMLFIDTANPRAIANLNTDLNPYVIDPEVLAFMRTEAPYMNQPRLSIFNVSLYQGTRLMTPDSITIDSNLVVTTTFDPDLRQNYHLRLAILTDITKLTGRGSTALQGNCGAAVKIFDSLDPTLKLRGLLPTCIMPGNWLPKPGLQQVGDGLNAGTISKGNNQTYGSMKTVATASIIAHRDTVRN